MAVLYGRIIAAAYIVHGNAAANNCQAGYELTAWGANAGFYT
jgi:hypothetical protein